MLKILVYIAFGIYCGNQGRAAGQVRASAVQIIADFESEKMQRVDREMLNWLTAEVSIIAAKKCNMAAKKSGSAGFDIMKEETNFRFLEENLPIFFAESVPHVMKWI